MYFLNKKIIAESNKLKNLKMIENENTFWFMSLMSPYFTSLPISIFIPFTQENPQSNKKEELESLDNPCDQRQDLPSEQNKGALDSSQCSPSPASQEDLESEISEDSDQEVDIEGDKGYFNAGWWPLTLACSENWTWE